MMHSQYPTNRMQFFLYQLKLVLKHKHNYLSSPVCSCTEVNSPTSNILNPILNPWNLKVIIITGRTMKSVMWFIKRSKLGRKIIMNCSWPSKYVVLFREWCSWGEQWLLTRLQHVRGFRFLDPNADIYHILKGSVGRWNWISFSPVRVCCMIPIFGIWYVKLHIITKIAQCSQKQERGNHGY